MQFFKNKVVIAIVSIIGAVLILAGVAGVTGGKNSPITNAVGIVFSPVQKAVSAVASSVDDFTVFVWEMRGYKQENERLVGEINKLKKENRSIEDYKNENERLKDLLGLKQAMTDFDTITAKVIAYEPNNWFESVVIDCGEKDGVTKEAVVMTADGVVGQITESGANWARVSPIINADNALGARVIRTGDIAVVEGDPSLGRDSLCKMTFIAKDASLIVGDMIETSGLGGIYPEGLTVGKVKEIHSDNAGAMQYAVIEPAVDFIRMHEVLIIRQGE